MRILITGAGGQIGGDLTDVLRGRGHHVIATDVAAPGPGRAADEWHHLDVSDKGAVLAATFAAHDLFLARIGRVVEGAGVSLA